MKRRTLLKHSLAASLTSLAGAVPNAPAWRLATFEADVTPPLGHACMGGGVLPVKSVADPLYARGCVLLGGDQPLVMVSIEYCEIRNRSYDAWRSGLAKAAGTTADRVLLSATHVHNAPVMDEDAEGLLKASGSQGSVCDPAFNAEAIARTVKALSAALVQAAPVSHFGIGQAKVEGVASNRRAVLPDGTITYNRMSRCTDPLLRNAADGDIDPWLKTLSFWSDDRPLFALHGYAVHPMSYYGGGDVTADFPGLALKGMRESTPGPLHVYASGCSGNVTAGKYNDGQPETRPILAERLHAAMKQAWQSTEKHAMTKARFSKSELRLEARDSIGFTKAALETRLGDANEKPFGQCLAALGLSWRARVERGEAIDVPAIDFGGAKVLLLPAEAYVEYQLLAQKLCGDTPVLVMGYGESAPGYIPIERAWRERDSNLHDWCWVNPGSEARMTEAIRQALA